MPEKKIRLHLSSINGNFWITIQQLSSDTSMQHNSVFLASIKPKLQCQDNLHYREFYWKLFSMSSVVWITGTRVQRIIFLKATNTVVKCCLKPQTYLRNGLPAWYHYICEFKICFRQPIYEKASLVVCFCVLQVEWTSEMLIDKWSIVMRCKQVCKRGYICRD